MFITELLKAMDASPIIALVVDVSPIIALVVLAYEEYLCASDFTFLAGELAG